MSDHRSRQTEDNEYVCDHCKKRFLSKSNLIGHMNIHTDNYRCTECGKCCESGSQLAVHRRSHSGEKLFECTVCSKRFTTSDSTAEFTVERNRTNATNYYGRQRCVVAEEQTEAINTANVTK